MSSTIPLYLFTKAPVPGEVKTRMQPQLSSTKAAELSMLMLTHCVEKVCQYWAGRVVLAVAPDTTHRVFYELVARYEIEMTVQIGDDLGERMLHAIEKGVSMSGKAVVMGSDVPHISGQCLEQAHRDILAGKNIINPSNDGGFYLFGLNSVHKAIFADVVWGGDAVFELVLKNAAAQGVDLRQGDTLRDIDRWDDLCWLADQDIRYRGFVN